jgi:Transposase DDE domain
LVLGRPDRVALVFGRKVTRRTPGRFHTKVITRGVDPALQVHYKRSKVKSACNRLGQGALPQAPGTAEPVFGQIKSNRAANRFSRCGRSAVRSEWRLLTATHNLLKLHQHRLAAA